MTKVTPPFWFWLVGIFAFFWNIMGLMNFILSQFFAGLITDGLSEPERNMIQSIPSWAVASFGIATISGLVASLGLLLRKSWSKLLFVISLIAATLQFYNWLFIQKAQLVFGSPETFIMPAAVLLLGLFFILLSSYFQKKGWIL